MVELDEIPQAARDHMQNINAADVVIGVFDADTPEKIERVLSTARESFKLLARPVRAVVLHGGPAVQPAPPEQAVPRGFPQNGDRLHALPFPMDSGSLGDPVHSVFRAYRA